MKRDANSMARVPTVAGGWLWAVALAVAMAGTACVPPYWYQEPEPAPPVDIDQDDDGYTTGIDCDDADPSVNPGATELVGNGVDDDCDGQVDELPPSDTDLDGDGYSEVEGDCNDKDPGVHPGAEELPDGVDNDCDAASVGGCVNWIDEGLSTGDDDCDGYSEAEGDCNDDPLAFGNGIHPGAAEVPNGVDDDCDGAIDDDICDTDDDGDGYTCEDGDCAPSNPAIFPGASEVCDGLDNDCDFVIDDGLDGDGDGWTLCAGDCDDDDASVRPGATEACNGRDDDCDGAVDTDAADPPTWYQDGDGDGHGNPLVYARSCEAPAGTVADGTDCNDASATVHPGAADVCDDFPDNDCDGETDLLERDDDGDLYAECTEPEADCDDADPAVHPGDGADLDVCDGVLDNDCDGVVDPSERDDDGDGHTDCAGDCDDARPDVYPGAADVCDDVLDNDCDGVADPLETDDDGDGVNSCSGDCDDSSATVGPMAPEVPGTGADEDCDGAIDEGMNVIARHVDVGVDAEVLVDIPLPPVYDECLPLVTWDSVNDEGGDCGSGGTCDVHWAAEAGDLDGDGAITFTLSTLRCGEYGGYVPARAHAALFCFAGPEGYLVIDEISAASEVNVAYTVPAEAAAETVNFCGVTDVDTGGDCDFGYGCEVTETMTGFEVQTDQEDGNGSDATVSVFMLGTSADVYVEHRPFSVSSGGDEVVYHSYGVGEGMPGQHVAFVFVDKNDNGSGDDDHSFFNARCEDVPSQSKVMCTIAVDGTISHVSGSVLFLDGDFPDTEWP